MKTLFETKIAGFDIKLSRGAGGYAVTYGKQFICHLTEGEARVELGHCIFHALACEGKLDD